MNRMEATSVLARLTAHFPRLGGDEDDPAALARLRDWLGVIQRVGLHEGDRITSLLVERMKRAPTIADWQETAREVHSEHGPTKPSVSYWAQLLRPQEGNHHGEIVNSPCFPTQDGLVVWIRDHREDGDDIYPNRRERLGNGYRDVLLRAEEGELDVRV